MRSDLTEIAFILDRSGSMQPLTQEAVGGFNAFLETQQKEPGVVLFSLVLFDHEYLVMHRSRDIHRVPKLTDQVYQAAGQPPYWMPSLLPWTDLARNWTKRPKRCVPAQSLSRS